MCGSRAPRRLKLRGAYELIEWGAALVFGGDTGTAYLGTQGDECDAQKDMALAFSGALVAMALTAGVHRARGRPSAECIEAGRAPASD